MKNAIVTGASRGIGRAIAVELASAGYRVLVNYLRADDEARETMKIIENAGGTAVLAKADVSDFSSVSLMINDFCDRYGNINALVLNAGIYIRRKLKDMTLNDWKRTIAVNLNGAFYPVFAARDCMADNSSIVFIASQLAFRGSTSSVAYGASKAGILGLMRSLALHLAPKVRVNAVSPGTIDTDIISSYTEHMRKERERSIPLGRIGTPDEVAKVVLFLVSEESSYITGANVDVNGGVFIH